MALYGKVELKMDVGGGKESECLDEIHKLGYPNYLLAVLYRLLVSLLPYPFSFASIILSLPMLQISSLTRFALLST
jgi:hypothetical protein